MINMIKADLYRLLRSKMAYIAVGILLLSGALAIWQKTPGASFFSSSVDVEVVSTDTQQEAAPGLDNLTNSLDTVKNEQTTPTLDKKMLEKGFNLYFVFIFLIGVIAVQDFSYKAIKNSLTSAIDRRLYYWSKVVTSLLVCLIIAFGYTLFVYGTNVILNGTSDASSLLELLKITALQSPYYIGLVGILVSIIFVGQKSAGYYGLGIALPIVVTIVLLTLQLSGAIDLTAIMPFEPQTALQIVAGNPTNDYLLKFTATGLIGFGLFTAFSYIKFLHTEIK